MQKSIQPTENNVIANNLSDIISKVHLIGTVIATPKNLSSAILSEEGMPEKTYRIGDCLKSGDIIVDITMNSIILSHKGILQHILLRPD